MLLKENLDLKDLSFKVAPGEKCVLVSDSKDSSGLLLKALGCELEAVRGAFCVRGSVVLQDEFMNFVEDTIQQNILMGQDFDYGKYWRILKQVGLEDLFRGVPSIERTLVLNNGHEIPPDLRKLVILARLLYLDSDVYLIDRFFDRLPLKYRETGLLDILRSLPNKTFIVCTACPDLVKSLDRILLLEKKKITLDTPATKLTPNELEDLQEHLQALEEPTEPAEADERDDRTYIDRMTNVSKQRSNSQRQLLVSEDFKKSLKGLLKTHEKKGLYFKIEEREDSKAKYKASLVLTKFFLFNSGCALPVLIVLLILANLLLGYFFSWFVTSWKQSVFSEKLTQTQILEYYAFLNLAALLVLASTAKAMVVYVRAASFKLFVIMVKGLLAHSLEFFHSVSPAQIISVVITEFMTLDDTMGSSLYLVLVGTLRLHVVLAISLYEAYYTGPAIFLVYLLIMRALFQVTKGAKQIRNVIMANQAVLVQTVLETHRSIINIRNCSRLKYQKDRFMMINEVYQNSRVHQNNLTERWLCNRIFGYVLFVPVLLLLNGLIRTRLGGGDDPFLGIKVTISLDLVFTVKNLLVSSINRAVLQASLEKIRELVIADEASQARRLLGGEAQAGTGLAGPARRLEVRDLNIVNPVTTLPMLSEIHLHADRGFKIALVGSRGSGKNTLLAAVQRLVDPCQVLSGKLYVDGRNSQTVADQDFHRFVFRLTGKFKLFAGSLRQNLDPLLEFSDLQIIRALEYVGYWKLVEDEKKANAIPRTRGPDRKRASSNPSVSLAIERIKKRFHITSADAEPVPSFSTKHKLLAKTDKPASKDTLKNLRKNNPLRKLNSTQAANEEPGPDEQNSAEVSRTQYFQPSFNKDQTSKTFLDVEEEIEKSRLTQVEASFSFAAKEPVGDEVAQPSKRLNRQASIFKNHRNLELHEDLDLRIEGCSYEERADDLDLGSDEELGVLALNKHLNQDRGKRHLSGIKLTQ